MTHCRHVIRESIETAMTVEWALGINYLSYAKCTRLEHQEMHTLLKTHADNHGLLNCISMHHERPEDS